METDVSVGEAYLADVSGRRGVVLEAKQDTVVCNEVHANRLAARRRLSGCVQRRG